MKRTILAAGMVAALGMAGLGTPAHASSPSRSQPVSVTVTLKDFKILMSRHRVPAGRPIRFVITNRGKAMHEVVLERAGAVDKALEVRGKAYEADDISPGISRTVTWTVPRTGRYQLACHLPGHFEMGMKTTFTVMSS